ncbi:hypothetical protein BGZ52_009557 [Haplosporangium bisporale]|nr:hypothetical protein BGZ52_009557 [Haplosporangium bisporale]
MHGHISNLSRSLPPTPSQLHPYANDDDDSNEHALPEDYFGESEEVPLPFPIKTIVADPQTGLSLTLISALGAGSYAVVYLAKEVASGSLYALKCLGKDKLTEEEVAVQRTEVVIHTSLPKHSNIIHLFNMFETTNHLFLLLEYSSGMDMYQWISMRSDRTDPVSGSAYTPAARLSVIKSVFDQVLEGVSQVHHCGVAHRDLKPENFLIEHADGQYTVKITDFGLATTDMESDEFECGSKPYMSYECRNGDTPYNVQMADIWSLGIILINLLYHRCPWSDPCPEESYAFSSFLCNRVDFLQRRFEDMPGPVARWLGLHAFAFVEPKKKCRRRTRPTMIEWQQWMEAFVPRMLGEMDTMADSDGQEEEDELEGQEVEGDEIFDEDSDEDDESQDHVVPIAIHMSSSHRDHDRHPLSYGRQLDTRGPSFSGSIPKFDPSAFYQPTRLRQESWSDAIDMEGTEDAEMDFSAPILFEESGEEDAEQNREEEKEHDDDDDDETGLAMALPDDFIEPAFSDTTPTGDSKVMMPHLKFSRQPDLRFDLEASRSSGESSKRDRTSPGFEKDMINTLVFIEPDMSRIHESSQISSGNLASSLPSTSHMDLQLGSTQDVAQQNHPHLKHRMKKPLRDLQEVKAAPFVFPPLKTPTSSGYAQSDGQTQKESRAPETNLNQGQLPSTKTGGASTRGPHRVDGFNSSNTRGPSGQGSNSTGNNWGTSRHTSTPSANWRKSHHRGSSWTSIDESWDSRRKQQDGSYSRGSRNERHHGDYRDEGSMGLPPRVENKFRPRYRQGRRPNNVSHNHNNSVNNINNFNMHAALPPAPPTHLSFGGPSRSRHQSRSGSVFDPPSHQNEHYQSPQSNIQSQNQQQQTFGKQGHKDGHKREAPFTGTIKYENSQLRTSKSSSGQSRLAGQRNKSLIDLRTLDATSQPWRQTQPQNPTPNTSITKDETSFSLTKQGPDSHPLEDRSGLGSQRLDRIHGDNITKDNVYHPPQWYERRSSHAPGQRRPPSGTEADFAGWQKYDGSSPLAFPSKNRSGSKGRISLGQGQGQGQGGLAQGSSTTSGSSPVDRKKHQQRSTGSLSSNWRGPPPELTGDLDTSRHYKKSGDISTQHGGANAFLSTTTSSIIRTNTDSPLMTLTPPTPSVATKPDFLAPSKKEGDDLETKTIVQPGAMQGLGNMLRGLVAYNKNIKVAGEQVDATSGDKGSVEGVMAATSQPLLPEQDSG